MGKKDIFLLEDNDITRERMKERLNQDYPNINVKAFRSADHLLSKFSLKNVPDIMIIDIFNPHTLILKYKMLRGIIYFFRTIVLKIYKVFYLNPKFIKLKQRIENGDSVDTYGSIKEFKFFPWGGIQVLYFLVAHIDQINRESKKRPIIIINSIFYSSGEVIFRVKPMAIALEQIIGIFDNKFSSKFGEINKEKFPSSRLKYFFEIEKPESGKFADISMNMLKPIPKEKIIEDVVYFIEKFGDIIKIIGERDGKSV